jgi:hypothetical protein
MRRVRRDRNLPTIAEQLDRMDEIGVDAYIAEQERDFDDLFAYIANDDELDKLLEWITRDGNSEFASLFAQAERDDEIKSLIAQAERDGPNPQARETRNRSAASAARSRWDVDVFEADGLYLIARDAVCRVIGRYIIGERRPSDWVSRAAAWAPVTDHESLPAIVKEAISWGDLDPDKFVWGPGIQIGHQGERIDQPAAGDA